MCVVVVIALINYVASHNIITMQHKHYNKDGGQGEDIPAAQFVASPTPREHCVVFL